MNLLLLVVLVSILLLVLGNTSRPVDEVPNVPKDTGYKVIRDYYMDTSSVYGAFRN